MKTVLVLIGWCLWLTASAQPNCLIFPEGSPCREACRLCERAIKFDQGSRESQVRFDSAIAICPTLAYAWSEKSVPYLKRGDFVTWRALLDKAVALEPRQHLGRRAGCLFNFLRDYKNALKDLKTLETLTKNPFLGYNSNGDYDLRIVKAMCQRKLGMTKQALQTFATCIRVNEKRKWVGPYEYYHYGAMLYELGRYDDALKQFEKQAKAYENFAETYYFIGLIYERRKDPKTAKTYFQTALTKYSKTGYHRNDPYCVLPDQIFLSDIQKKLTRYAVRL